MSIEKLPSPPFERKRKYYHGITTSKLEESRQELAILKGRNVSPATKIFIDGMISLCDKLETLDRSDFQYSAARIEMHRHEAALHSRFEKDEKYADQLAAFREMETRALMLRYGDYLADHCTTLKQKSRLRGKSGEGDGLANMSWTQISWILHQEEAAMDEFSSLSKEKPPKTPTTDLITMLAELCAMPLETAIFSIHFYSQRCRVAHSGLQETYDVPIEMANFIIRDREAIINGVLVGSVAEQKDDLLKALKHYEDKFFRKIVCRIDKESGLKILDHYELTKQYTAIREEQLKREQMEAAEKAKVAGGKLTADNNNRVYKRAKNAKETHGDDPDARWAIDEVLSSRKEKEEQDAVTEKAMKTWQEAQKLSAAANAKYQRTLVAFDKAVPEPEGYEPEDDKAKVDGAPKWIESKLDGVPKVDGSDEDEVGNGCRWI